MVRKLITPLLPSLLVLLLAGFLIPAGNHAALVSAQTVARTAARTTTLIVRKPLRIIGDDPYSNFTGVAIDEQRGQVFLSNDSDAKGSSIEAYNVEFPA